MPSIIPVPVTVSVGVSPANDVSGSVKNFGSFKLLPYATTRNGTLEVAQWLLMMANGEAEELEEVSMFEVIPRKLLWHVCQKTFEADIESIPLVFTIDDQQWKFPICARELEYEQVHYMIEVEGEWLKLTELPISEVIGEDQFIFCEREVLPTIDFGDIPSIIENMS